MSDAEIGPHEVWCDTQNAISQRCNCMASTYIDKIEEMQKRIEKLEAALMTVLNQPFKGSWDAQAVFIQEALKGEE